MQITAESVVMTTQHVTCQCPVHNLFLPCVLNFGFLFRCTKGVSLGAVKNQPLYKINDIKPKAFLISWVADIHEIHCSLSPAVLYWCRLIFLFCLVIADREPHIGHWQLKKVSIIVRVWKPMRSILMERDKPIADVPSGGQHMHTTRSISTLWNMRLIFHF